MKKILSLIILVVTWYFISIFLAPSYADKIWDLLNIKFFNEQFRNYFWKVNKIATDIPSVDEMQKKYTETIDTVKDWIDKTKNTIDGVRSTLSWAENTFNKAKDFYNETSDSIDKVKSSLNDIDKMNKIIKWTVNTEIVK